MVKFKALRFEVVRAVDAARYANELADVLHDDDRREMFYLGVRPNPYIKETIMNSTECMAVRGEDGGLLNMMGICAGIKTTMGVPVWSLKAEGEREYRKEFVYFGLQAIEHFLSLEPKLFNYISRENKSSLRFIKRAGAVVFEPMPYGPNGNLFCPFILTREAFKGCVE